MNFLFRLVTLTSLLLSVVAMAAVDLDKIREVHLEKDLVSIDSIDGSQVTLTFDDKALPNLSRLASDCISPDRRACPEVISLDVIKKNGERISVNISKFSVSQWSLARKAKIYKVKYSQRDSNGNVLVVLDDSVCDEETTSNSANGKKAKYSQRDSNGNVLITLDDSVCEQGRKAKYSQRDSNGNVMVVPNTITFTGIVSVK